MSAVKRGATPSRFCALAALILTLSACSGPRGNEGNPPEVTTVAMEAEAPERRGLLEISAASGPAERRVTAPVAALPFGEVAVLCDVDPAALGHEVGRSSGRERYALHDSDPGSIAPRAHYLTGFKDGCARQFTASLALFGSAQMHETTRYNPLNTTAYTEADDAYEAVKRKICRAARGEYCTGRGARRMDRQAAFLSVYRDFGGGGQWMEMFLFKGALEAYSVLGEKAATSG